MGVTLFSAQKGAWRAEATVNKPGLCVWYMYVYVYVCLGLGLGFLVFDNPNLDVYKIISAQPWYIYVIQ